MAFISASLVPDSLHRVEQNGTLVAVKGSITIEDDALGSRVVRVQITGAQLAAWANAGNVAARRALLRAAVAPILRRAHSRWTAELGQLSGVEIVDNEFGVPITKL